MIKIFSFSSNKKKSSNKVFSTIKDIFQKKTKVDNQLVEELEEILIMADFGVSATADLIKNLRKQKFAENELFDTVVKDFLSSQIEEILLPCEKNLEFSESKEKLQILTFNGVNGSGKTTSIGKIANKFKESNKKIIFAACDTFRAAAKSQLQVWADRSNSPVVYAQKENQDPASVAYKAIDQALKENYDIVMIDTAGRLQNKVNLMAELQKTHKIISKFSQKAEITNFIILDANIGQNNFSQLELFNQIIDISGIIINKLDNSSKAGFLVPLVKKFSKPIYAIGVGENINDLEQFQAKSFSKSLFND
jgi:fused signal recognition particle receptor